MGIQGNALACPFPKTLTSPVSARGANGTSVRKCLPTPFENTQGQSCYFSHSSVSRMVEEGHNWRKEQLIRLYLEKKGPG